MTSATRGPKLPIVAGCLRGLVALMYNFTKSVDEGMCFFCVKDSHTIGYILIIIQPASSTISRCELRVKIFPLVDGLCKSKAYPAYMVLVCLCVEWLHQCVFVHKCLKCYFLPVIGQLRTPH